MDLLAICRPRASALSVLLLTSAAAHAADGPKLLNARTFVEVRTLAALPPGVSTALGRGKSGRAGIADTREQFNGTDVIDPRFPMRRFIVGGASSDCVLVAYDRGNELDSFHAVVYARSSGSEWRRSEYWILRGRPHSLAELVNLINGQRLTFYRPISGYDPMLGQRAARTRPARRDGPLRELNVSDEEVREMQAVTARIAPGFILNISGVVTGCPCDDGPTCSDQVWIVAYRPEQTRGLLLSRIDGHWTLGPVQQWWLDWQNLIDNERRYEPRTRAKAWDELYHRYPMCAADGADTAAPAAPP